MCLIVCVCFGCPIYVIRFIRLLTGVDKQNLRKLTKQIQDARIAHDQQAIKDALKHYDDALER